MKFTKKNKIIMSVTAGVIAIAVIVTTILLTGGKTSSPVIDDPDTSKPSSNVVVNQPSDDPSGSENTTSTEKEADDALVIDVGGNPKNPADTESSDNNDNPVKTPESPVETQKPEQPADNSSGGISIGGDDHDHASYNCGAANHHCASPESHAFITNLEIEGCPICGSHSCPSFYALDQWGYTLYTPSKCPKYDIKNDPLYYCQDCGKKVGDGSNGTCVQFINACNCPLCGEYVPARTCHTCK